MTASFASPEFIKGRWRVHPCGAVLGDQIHMPDGKIVCTVCGEPAIEAVDPKTLLRLSRDERRIVDFLKANPTMRMKEAAVALDRPYPSVSNAKVKARKLGLLPPAERD